MTKYRAIRGFTMIELSISLVLLTLLITAIAGGASLIESAKYRKVISEFNQYKFMVKEFEIRYDATPGKFNNAHSYWPPTVVLLDEFVDGSGGIGGVDSKYETPLVWVHLSKAGLVGETFDYTDQTAGYVGSGAAGISKFAPNSSAFDDGGFMMVKGSAAPYATAISAFSDTTDNVLYLAASASMATSLDIPLGVMKPVDVFLIETKIDDGKIDGSGNKIGGSTGKIRTINSLAYISSFDCVNPSGHYTDNDYKSCIIGFRMY